MGKKSHSQSIEDLSLMLLYLTRFYDRNSAGLRGAHTGYLELSWKNYDFDTIDRLDEKNYIFKPDKSKYVYLNDAGVKRAKELIEEYGFSDNEINERFEFREIRPEEADEAVKIEQICFPPNEACSEKHMKERIEAAPELFLVAVDKENGKMAGFLNGIATDEIEFKDDFFTDISLHKADGKCVMLTGLDVLPEYRKKGLARELVLKYLRKEYDRRRRRLVLTCHKEKIKMYSKLGFVDRGISGSTWGGEEWHEMDVCFPYFSED